MAISLKQAQDVILYTPRRRCVVTLSPPGTGKSASAYAAARRAGAVYVEKYTGVMEALDANGVPYVADCPNGRKVMLWAAPGDWPIEAIAHEFPDKQEIIVNLDDWFQATPPVQRATARGVYGDGKGRKIGSHSLLPNVRFVGTSNREQDRSGVYRPEQYVNNRVVYLEVEPDIEEWCSGAISGFAVPERDDNYPDVRARIDAEVAKGIPDTLIAFVKQFKQCYDFTPDARSFMSPRSLECLGEFIRAFDAAGINGALLQEVANGTIGEANAMKFMAFHKFRDELPDVDALLKGESVPLPPKTEVLYILVTAVLRAAKKEHTEAVAKLANRIADCRTKDGKVVGVEVSHYLITECLRGAATKQLRGLSTSPLVREWIQTNKDYFLDQS